MEGQEKIWIREEQKVGQNKIILMKEEEVTVLLAKVG